MFNTDFEYLIDEYMVYCKSRQLREKTLISYEQALRLFQRWCKEEMKIMDVLDHHRACYTIDILLQTYTMKNIMVA